MKTRLRLLAVVLGFFAATPRSAECLAGQRVPFEALFRQAYELRRSQLGPEHPDTIASLVRLGALLRTHGRAADAEPLLRQALGALGQSGTEEVEILVELAETLAALGRAAEAEDSYRRSLERAEPGMRNARTLLRIAGLREMIGDAAGARQAYLDALRDFEESGSLPVDERKVLAEAMNDLGLLLEAGGEFEAAEAMYRRSAEAHHEAFGNNHPATSAARANLAGMLALRGEAASAAALLERSVGVIRAAYGPRHDDTARLHNRLGEIYEVLGRFEKAEEQYLAALAGWEEPSPSRGQALTDLGRLEGVREDFAAAATTLAEAVRTLESAQPGFAAEFAEALDSYGSVLRALGRLDEAERTLRKALAIREQELGASHPDVALTLVGLAGVLHLRGDLAQAKPLYRNALAIQEETLGPAHPDVGETLYNLAHLAQALGDTEAARDGFARSAEILSEAYGPDDPFVASIRAALRALR